jgi:hypothetical protein
MIVSVPQELRALEAPEEFRFGDVRRGRIASPTRIRHSGPWHEGHATTNSIGSYSPLKRSTSVQRPDPMGHEPPIIRAGPGEKDDVRSGPRKEHRGLAFGLPGFWLESQWCVIHRGAWLQWSQFGSEHPPPGDLPRST